MAIKFNIHEIGNPRDPDAPKKFYARPIHFGELSLEEVATEYLGLSVVHVSKYVR